MITATPPFMAATPEIIVASMICVIMLVDLFLKKTQKRVVYTLSQLTIIVAAAFTWHDFGVHEIIFQQQFILDDLAWILKLTLYLLALGVLVYSRDYTQHHTRPAFTEFHLLTLFSLLGAMVLISANSLLTIYVGLELLSLPLYALVALKRDTAHSSEAAMKYFVMGALASGMLLYGISMVYGATGCLVLPSIATAAANTVHPSVLLVGLIFLLAGLAFKFGAVPFHFWVADVYEGAPFSVATYVATVPKIAGFAMLIRLLHDMLPLQQANWSPILFVLAILSLIIGNLLAIVQKNIRRMFAYSTIAHVGFIFLGVGLGTAEGNAAALFYSITYGLTALGGLGILTLLNAHSDSFNHIEDFSGLNSRNPWLAFMMMLLLLSMAGIPPLIGFDAKLLILNALIHQHHFYLAGIVLLMSVIGAYYYLYVIKTMYFDMPATTQKVKIAGSGKVGSTLNGLAVLLLGCLPGGLIMLCQAAFN